MCVRSQCIAYEQRSFLWQCFAGLKRLYQGCYAWPKTDEAGALRVLAEELTLLLSGIDLEKTSTRPWWRKTAA